MADLTSVVGSIVQGVENILNDVVGLVESVLGGLGLPVPPLPTAAGSLNHSGLLDSAPGGSSLALSSHVPGLSSIESLAKPSVGGALSEAVGGHAVPFHDNTQLVVAPIKH